MYGLDLYLVVYRRADNDVLLSGTRSLPVTHVISVVVRTILSPYCRVYLGLEYLQDVLAEPHCALRKHS